MNFKLVEYLVKDRISYISLNRPEKRNAFNEALVNELKIAFIHAEENPEVKVVVLGGKGKVFSAGADLEYLQSLQNNSFEENLADSNNLKELYQHIYQFKKIVIAKVEGHAIAGGAGLATVCDFTFSVPDALFGYTEVKIGFIPAIVMVFLIRKIGEAKAKELLLTGKLVSADEAKALGIINTIIPSEDMASSVHSFAMELASSTSAQSIENTKHMMSRLSTMTLDEAFNFAAEMNAKGRESEDCKKGIEAFLKKEKISW
jgi:methylglutaconyl-CoA hydratase